MHSDIQPKVLPTLKTKWPVIIKMLLFINFKAVLGNNLKKIQDTWLFSGAPDESFGSTFGPGSTGWETLL